MKYLSFLFLLCLNIAGFSQIQTTRISQLPTFGAVPVNGWLPIVIDGVTYKIDVSKIASTQTSTGTTTLNLDSVTLVAGKGVDTLKNWFNGVSKIYGYVDKQGGLVSGGAVNYTGVGLTFTVSPATYYVNWTRVNSPPGQVTLPAADNHFNTIDAIGLDKTGHAIVIPGVPALNPLTPQVDPSQAIYLTSVLVRAGDTIPSGVKLAKIYDENLDPEWDITSTGLTFDANNTLAPQHLSKDISTNSWVNGSKLTFSGSTASLADYNLLQLYLNQKVAPTATSSITVTFYNNNVQVSSPTQLAYDKTIYGFYQPISLDLSSVSFTSTSFNTIVITFNGNNTNGVYIDNIQLQGGVVINTTVLGVNSFNLRKGNVVPMPNDYKVTDITGLIDSLAKRQPLLPKGDSTQIWRADGSLGTILVPKVDSVTFTNDFRNTGPKGFPIISLKPNGTNVGTFTNATVSVDSTGRVIGISSGAAGGGGGTSTPQVNSDWNATSGFAQILNKPTIPVPIDTSLMHNEIVQNTNAITTINNKIGVNTNLPNGVISGGYLSWSGTGLIYNVTPAVYRINNKIYTSPETVLTLGAANNTFNRIDQIILDTLGVVSTLAGTASANPATPQINPASQWGLTTITVTAGSATPVNIYTTNIYDENTEWTGGAFGIAPNFSNTTYFAHLFRSMSIPSWTDGNAITFANGTGAGSTININNYSALTFYVRLDAPVTSGANVSVAFLNDQNQMCGAVQLTTAFGFDKNITGIFQPVTIPISSFYFNNGYLVNTLKLFLSGANTTGLEVDFIQLQAGASQGTSNYLTDISLHGVDSVGQTKNGIWNFKFRLPAAGGGGTGTVTSVAKGYGLVQDGTITTSGTNTVDTLIISTKANAIKLADGKLNISDTAAMFAAHPSGTAGGNVTISQTITTSPGTISNPTTWLIVNPVSTLSTLTITMPASPTDGQVIAISFGGTIRTGDVVTALTISPNSGQSILQNTAPTSVAAGELISYKYNSANTTYYRIN